MADIKSIGTQINGGSVGAGASGRTGTSPASGSDQKQNFSDVWKQIQGSMGAKPRKPREIKKTLDKDAFLRIMVTQMKNQDPTEPFKAEKMATEMAQFASIEQLKNINTNLTRMQGAQKPIERLAMTGLIGKTITTDRNRFVHEENKMDFVSFVLPEDAQMVDVSVVDMRTGEIVAEENLGKKAKGEITFNWDGVQKNTTQAKTGEYMIRVKAQASSGKPIVMQSQSQATVVGVNFSGKEPVLLVGDINKPHKISMQNVVQVDSFMKAPIDPKKQAEMNKVNNMFTFQKGIGSKGLSTDAAKKAADSIKKEAVSKPSFNANGMNVQDVAKKLIQSQENKAKKNGIQGFANGLGDFKDPVSAKERAEMLGQNQKTNQKGGKR